MLISYDKRFAFVHVGKTAGTNVTRCLEPHAHRPQDEPVNRMLERVGVRANYLGPLRWRRFRIHATAATARRHLPRGVWDSLYSFAFVRNPWERLVSQYEFMRRNDRHHQHRTVLRLGSFAAFVDWEARRGRRRMQRPSVVDSGGRVIVSFVGRFETLADDFAGVLGRLGIDATLPGRPEGNASGYRDYYADPAVRAAADAMLAGDAALFAYDFDGPTCDTAALNERLPKGSRNEARP